ncbi:hypothetical protein [Pseudomonas sp. Teo4]|uniref:hypothetical protein n=1 Tax=Pseudomonas sp. Teo4 TaxID=3064528 RepID=UPI002AB9EEDB|nr:hypothetical protein [Pseudomonas sp. Teo4]MDZ3990763.1 hypothetical protein [Pseudomonas sp. Teo4]
MLKIVPDPPHASDVAHYLEDTLIQATEYVLCALAVAHHSVSTLPKSPCSLMTLEVMHEMEAVRALLESAVAQVQMKERPQMHTLH